MSEQANAARMYDWFLGGAHNLEVDRAAGQRLLDRFPGIVASARANRDFLRRAVRWCLTHGIDQFLDLGSGVPTAGNVHEIVAVSGSSGRVLYVEVEPVAVAASRALLADREDASVVAADLRDVETVLAAAAERLDLDRPVALLAVAVLHFLPDTAGADDPAAVLARYRRALAPGSAVVVSHNSADHDDPALVAAMGETVAAMAGTENPLFARDRAALRAILSGVDLADPGVVPVTAWRPDPARGAPPPVSPVLGAAGLVRARR